MTQKAKHGIYEDFGDDYGGEDIGDLLAEGLVDFDLLPINRVAEEIMEERLREMNNPSPKRVFVDRPSLSPEEYAACTILFE
jgi:hypothetical protein